MTATELTAADVYAAYLQNESSPAKTAEALGISIATVGRRVRAHRAAIEQDTAAEQTQDTAPEAPAAAAPEGTNTVTLTPGNAQDVLDQVRDGEIRAEDVVIEGSTAQLVSVTAPEDAEPAEVIVTETGKVTECGDCGFHFPRPQQRRTCKSPAACARRKAERAAQAA